MPNVESKIVNGYRVKIMYDDDRESPREWANVGIMVCDHPRSNLGDRKPTPEELRAARKDFATLRRYLRRYAGATCVLPLYLYEHSGMTIRTRPFGDPWDSGCVGFTYDTPETRAETGVALDHVAEALTADVETYDQFLRGDVYGYMIESLGGEHIDSCFGMYGLDYCRAEALTIVKGLPRARTFTAQARPPKRFTYRGQRNVSGVVIAHVRPAEKKIA